MKKKARVLVVDDEEYTRGFFQRLLGEEGYDIATAADGEEALGLFTQKIFDLVLLDLKIPGSMDGMQILQRIKKIQPGTVVIMISGHGTLEVAVQAVKMGAENFISKPFNSIEEVLMHIEKALEYQKILRENALLHKQLALQIENRNMIGNSSRMQEVFERIRKVAPLETNILLMGESGTGKELAAQALHKNSRRHNKIFMTVNCGALPEHLLESTLFGFEGETFTGARKGGAKGYFEEADGGTIFLDEIGEASLPLQVKLLRALQEGEFKRVGGTETLYSDVRIISATNRDLTRAVQDGKFREDLYYRINVINIKLPPLRERKEDIPLLAHFFLKKFVEKEKKSVTSISADAMRLMTGYHWPGNVRQLENVIKGSAALCEGDTIDVFALPEEIRTIHPPVTEDNKVAPVLLPFKEAKEYFERRYIEDLLKASHNDVAAAARTSGIDVSTIYRKINRYHIKITE
ncbi:MAG: sigma-54 dependent transcriptional regulator [bacterium]